MRWRLDNSLMIKKRVRAYKYGNHWGAKRWNGVFTDVPCFLIGNGPSLDDVDVSLLGDHFTIGMNRAFMRIDPTILMWQDIQTWITEKKHIVRTKAIKFCRENAETQGRFYHYRLTVGDYKIPTHPAVLHGRGSTGPLAFQLAYKMGCNPIVLVGMDCCYREGKTDFYGVNHFHYPHTLRNCGKGLKWIKTFSEEKKIINCSPSKVFDDCYTLEEALDEIGGEKAYPRAMLHKKIVNRSK